MKLIKLTGAGGGESLYVNPEAVCMLAENLEERIVPSGTLGMERRVIPPHTGIETLGGDGQWMVNESVEDIIKAMGVEVIDLTSKKQKAKPKAKPKSKPKAKPKSRK